MEEELTIIAKSVNDAVKDTGEKINKSMSMVFLCIDLSTGDGFYLNAGHPGIYLLKKDGKAKPILKPGDLLGYDEKPKFGQETFSLASGDGLFIYTDGLLENRGPNNKTLTSRELHRILSSQEDLEALKSTLLKKTQDTWQGEDPIDDYTFLILKKK